MNERIREAIQRLLRGEREVSEEEEGKEIGCWVFPTDPARPPRALLLEQVDLDDVPDGQLPPGMKQMIEQSEGAIAPVKQTPIGWSNDSGTWLFEDGTPVPEEIATMATEHAKSLGVTYWD